jgi:hypothetical protein
MPIKQPNPERPAVQIGAKPTIPPAPIPAAAASPLPDPPILREAIAAAPFVSAKPMQAPITPPKAAPVPNLPTKEALKGKSMAERFRLRHAARIAAKKLP